ncbi:PHB depolymerase family esterase [Corynebacterium sp. ES2775-CONJ]|uniref:alpha/beta hydrolase family esterase n=1 Tax=Corynebacterium sp. ES2775-CONJ TaxID=2974029 RepID=UPI00216A92DE|nr:PHB depolymerase family esterase [Corynebacterium sp. ES2775-CONJ]MCS4489765.1 prolyl oligopeptidase family serine peptidase [Corynebacterium sp. ES2775-CONJ]
MAGSLIAFPLHDLSSTQPDPLHLDAVTPRVEEFLEPQLAAVEERADILSRNVARYGEDHSYNPVPPVAPGMQHSVEMRDDSGITRRYIVHIGSQYNLDNPAPAPVLFAFHGWKEGAEAFVKHSGFANTKAWEEAIAIYPQGLDSAWEGAPYAKATASEDMDFIRAILEQIDRDYKIDRNRVYAAGFSNGGGMAAALGCKMPETFAAIATVSAAFYFPTLDGCVRSPMPGLFVHSSEDQIISYEGGKRHGAYYYAPRFAADFEAVRNGCSQSTPDVDRFGNGERYIYRGCTAETQHIRIDGQPHKWILDPSLPGYIWNFLSSKSK